MAHGASYGSVSASMCNGLKPGRVALTFNVMHPLRHDGGAGIRDQRWGWFDLLNTTQWVSYYLMHIIPQIIIIIEWYNSSIQLHVENYWRTVLFCLPYCLMVAIYTIKE